MKPAESSGGVGTATAVGPNGGSVAAAVPPDAVQTSARHVATGGPNALDDGFVRSSSCALAARVCMAVSRGIGLVLISRALGATGFGDYSLILTAFAVGSGLGTFALDQAYVYLTGLERRDGPRLLSNALWLAAWLGACVGVMLLGGVHLLRERIFDTAPRDAVLATALALPAILHHNYVTGMIVGRSRFRYYGMAETAKWIAHVGILATLAATDRLTVCAALLALYVPIAVTGVVHHVLLQRADGVPFAATLRRPDIAMLRASLSYGARACLVNVTQVLHLRLDVYLVKYFTSPAVVGHYALATSIADVILYAGRSVGLVVFARSAVDPGPVARLAPRVTRVMVIVVSILAAVVALGRDVWVGVFFGREYIACSAAIVCRLPGIIAESLSLVLVGDFLGRALVLRVLIGTGTAVLTGLCLNVWLVPVGGIMAAASVFSIASFVRAGVLAALHGRISGLPWSRYFVPGPVDLRLVVAGLRRMCLRRVAR